jgi:multidrug efflux pump subunit AcrB
MFCDHPVFGVGFGRFYDRKLPYLSDRSQNFELESLRPLHHHNTLLSVLTETGLVGLAAFIGLFVGGKTLSIYSMIGILLLMGITKKNSIILVDYANQCREAGKDAAQAMLEAGPVRLRPILMTSVATMMAAVPSALAAQT